MTDDLHVKANFDAALEAASGNYRVLAEKYHIGEMTARRYRTHHDAGDVWIAGSSRWIARADAGESEAEGDSDAARELLAWLKGRTVPAALPPTAAAKSGGYSRALVFSDVHFPFVHEGAFEVLLGLADTMQPEEIVAAGDVFDFAQIGRFIRDPTKENRIVADVKACRERVLSRIGAAAPNSVKRFIVGNHEEGRWKQYLFTHCPEICDYAPLSMEAFLGLTEMGWQWQPYEYWPTDELCIFHGDRHTSALGGGSAMSARKESIDMGVSTLTGHTHHAGAFFRQDRAGYRVSHEIGMIGNARKMQEAGVTTSHTPAKTLDWHLACAVVYFKPGHSAFRVELIPIIDDGKRTFCIYRDQEIVA